MRIIQFFRRFRFLALIYSRYYLRNCIGWGCKAVDLVLRTNLAPRFHSARMGAMVQNALQKKPFNLHHLGGVQNKSFVTSKPIIPRPLPRAVFFDRPEPASAKKSLSFL